MQKFRNRENRRVSMIVGVVLGVILMAGVVLLYDGGFIGTAEAQSVNKKGWIESMVNPNDKTIGVDTFCIDGALVVRSRVEGGTNGMAGGHLVNLGNRNYCNIR